MKMAIERYKPILFVFLGCILVYVCDSSYRPPVISPFGSSANFIRAQQKREQSKDKVKLLGPVLRNQIAHFRQKGKVDLVFLVDGSGSVGQENFISEIRFVTKLLADFIVDQNSTRVAIVVYSSQKRVYRYVDYITTPGTDKHKCRLLNNDLPQIEYHGGGTYTLGAFQNAKEILRFGRKDAQQVIILITDGYSNGGDPRPEASILKKAGVRIFTFGIKNGNVQELVDMASEPKNETSYILTSFEEFEQLARRALHEDLRGGSILPQREKFCDHLCPEAHHCCHKKAECVCGTHTGHFECLCPPGYYGSGLREGCAPCPSGTYKPKSISGDISTCISCPNEENHITEPGATSAGQCVCKKGYLSTNRTDGDCSVLTCPKLDAPNNGYFVNKKCNNVYNAACGLRCEPGFELIGSSLRICKEIGIWSGTETLCIMKTCPPLPSPKHGNMICDKRDFMFATVCRFTCDTGYKLVGSRKRTCLAIALWTGITTRCREITCQPLPPLKDGFITDSVSGSSKCTGVDEVSFGTTCQISCAHGYKLLGPHTKQCTPDGLWIHSNEGGINQCIDTSAPFIRCPANIIANTNRDKATARVEWTTPVPVDNSGYIPIVTSVPAVTSPEHFPIGNTTIVYTAEDLNKNKNSCAFNITVIDNQAPTVDRCFSPFPVVSASPYINITWEPPLFSDNSDGDVKVTASHEPGLFPKGKTAVAYIAVDGAGNNSTCEIEINVLPHPCELPAAPANGLIHCAEDNDGVRCNVTCMEGYAFALDPAKTYFCAYDNVWRPKRKMPIPDCSVKILSNEVVQSTSVTFSGSLSCKEGRLLHNVETELENKISERVNVLCEDNVDCSVSSMETTCEDSDDFNKIDVVPRRARRSLLALKAIEVESEQGGDGYSSQLTFDFTLQGSVNTSGNHLEDYKRQQLAKENLQTIIKTLKQDAKSGRFDVEMHGEKIAFTDMVLGSKDPAYQCPTGKILVGDSCVNCPIGTFYNVISRKCQNCGVGTYQHQEGRLTCSVCPEHKSTQNNRTRSLEECKDLCLPGTFSSDGLERCETCHVGYFQQLYGQKSCLPCPGRRTTLKRGSRRKSLCKFRCPAGHVSKNGLRPCYPCPKGSYQPEEGQSSCYECINGTTTTRVASTNISDCEGDGVDVMLADEAALADQIAASECFTDPCRNGGTCISDIFGYECSCLPGYTGDHCEVLINKCDARPCLNGGVCQLQVNDYSCQCVEGFMGKKCEINIDDCLDNACLNGGTCIDGVNQYRCSCQSGFEGSYCEIKLDECASKPCQNGGRCVTEVGGYTCKCLSGFMGSNCEVDIDECASNPCQNEATCMDQDNRFSCICVYGYTGLLCETDINECSDIPCQNGGTCLDLIGKYKCLCLPGFTGNKCSQELSNNFQMDFTGSTVDYARLDVVRDLPAVTIAVWVKTDDTNNYGTPFSYAVGSNENALKLHDYNGFTVYVNGEHVVTDVQVNDGRWHHIALTWTKEGGLWRLYLDGALVEKAGGMSDGRNIAGGGVFIIGQEQDTPGGGFDSRESFIGSIAHLNMWNRELSLPEIQSLRIDCSKSVGNVIAWTDVLAGLRGSLQKIPSTFCGECPQPIVPEIGKLNITGITPGSYAHFTCPKGFFTRGQSSRVCLINGEWEGEGAYCEIVQCGRPNLIHGEVEGGRFSFDNRVRYRCYTGYKLIGPPTSYCSHTGKWLPEGAAPRCEKIVCILPSLSENTRVLNAKPEYLPGDVVQFACNSGYFFLTSHDYLNCEADGTWHETAPTCDHTTCGTPPPIDNGSPLAAIAQYTVGTNVVYECDYGYTFASSRESIACLPRGVWEQPYPRCVLITCAAPPLVDNADIISGDPTETTFLSTIEFRCRQGYESERSMIIECLEDAKWTTPTPRCTAVDCGRPDGISFGTLEVRAYSYSNVAVYRCDRGYSIQGVSTRICQADRTWSGSVPRCSPISCGQPGDLDNGYFSGSDFTYLQTVHYSCNDGYRFSDASTMFKTCAESGIWEGVENTCDPITCPVPGDIKYGGWRGDRVFIYQSKITYYCNSGYTLQGEAGLTCYDSGVWSSPFPTCTPVRCFDPPSIINGVARILGRTYGSKVEYRCNPGFTHDGADVIVCQADGKWSNDAPRCTAQQCPALTNITNGIVRYNAMAVGSLAAYTCNYGYERIGPEIRQCLSSLTWSEVEPTCGIIRCETLEDITNGRVIVESYTFQSTAVYECIGGYRLQGSSRRLCQADKTWSSLAPICDRVECDPLPTSIKNGLTIGRSYYYGDKVTFSCNDGYQLVGTSITNCQANGIWSSGVPYCEIVTCSPLTLPNGQLSSTRRTYASRISLSCNDNFRLIGPEQTFCQADGTWSSTAMRCIEIRCPVLEVPQFGRIEMSGRLVANFYCVDGYTLQGNQQLTCLENNEWSSVSPTCAPIQCKDLGDLVNGQIVLTDGHNYKSTANYVCDIGYRLLGESRVCQANGYWSATTASCEIKDCPQPSQIENGRIEGVDWTFGSVINYYCNVGYELSGTSLLICLETETWSETPPLCKRISCGEPEPVLNSYRVGDSYEYNDLVEYRCDRGYELFGDNTRKCLANKSWSGQKPSCVVISCPQPEKIENGEISGTSYTYGSTLRYTCHTGYSVSGETERQCLDTKQWSNRAPLCSIISCSEPVSISNGVINGATYTYQSQIEYVCDVGYTLHGDQIRNCLHTARWSGNTPSCQLIVCPVPKSIDNGVFSGSEFSFGSLIVYHCNEGYQMAGSNERLCMDRGQWSGDSPSCHIISCGQPESILNGRIQGDVYTYRQTVEYNCDIGYQLTGESSRLCKGDGSWSGLTPSCTIISCGDPGPIENGFIAGSAHTYQSVVTYSCDEGYSIQGETIRQCNEDGLWSGNKPSCIIKYCPVPQSIDNGAYTGTDYGFNSVITYRCDEGYTMTGSAVRTCLSSQQWSGSLPSCTLIVCRQPEPIPNGMIVGTRFNYNDVVEYSCDVGYDMDGFNSRRCLESGLWSGQRPNCIITNCPVPKPIDNGEITGKEYTFGSTVIYSCLTGYKIVGDSFRLCLQTKMWSGTEPSCAIIDCGNPGDIKNGVVKGSVFTYGSTVTYACDEGYSQEGRENRLCQDTGEWSGSLPSCTLIVCRQPEPIPNGMIVGTRFNYNDIIEYSCDVGYDMDGTNSRRCLQSGLWSGQRPNCIITNCPVPKAIDNGEITGKEYTFGSTVIYSCLTGYEIVGDSFRLCLQTKMWSGTEPSCAIIDCGNPGDIDNGVVKGSVFTYGSTVAYACDEGYSREGRENRLCQDTGEWSDSAPRCLIVNCAVPRVPDNGGISDSDYLFGSTINYNCVDGYELVGDTTRICLSSKQWSGTDPNCIKVTCDQLDAPNNGRIVGTDLTFESVVRVQCDTGYRLEGSEERICQADRAWSGVASICVEVRCPEIESLLNGRVHGTSVTYNSEVRYECNEGFDMIGQETRRCTASGAWSGNEPVCTIRVCPDPEPFVNGTINIDAGFDFGSTIIYECDEGYNIIGHRTRTCLSTQAWDVEAPVCEIVTCPVPAAVLNGASIGRSRNYADIIGYKCNSGYVLQGTEERVCQSNGRWSSEAPLCNPVDCGVPDIGVDNVRARLITGTTTLNSPVVLYCTEGYNLIGFGYARCTESGHWSETHVSCERVYCPHPGVIEHGTIEGTSFFFGDQITVDCDAGYRLDGQRSITCLSSGRWDTVIPNCKPVECIYPEELQNGYFEGKSFTYGNTIEYFCNDKYRMDGNGVRTCDSNGAWTGQIPSCQLVICEAPSIVPNGIVAESYMTVYTYGDELNYHCSAGYTLIGPSVIRCELTGEWSGKPPHCDRSDCPRPRDIDHGTITGNDYKYKGSITYLCDEGYVLSGDKERSCLDTGEWSGADPICDVVTCPEPASVDNARVAGLTTFQSTITYECFEGFRLIGDASFLCLASGEWNGEAPVCDKIKCAEPLPLSNGYIDGALYEYSSEISYSCDTGFILNGNDRRVCQSSGEWSGDAPTCDRIQCEEPPQLDNGQLSGNVFEYEATVQYSCNEGYSLRGSRSRTCLYDGSWSGIRPHCRILSCRVITPIDNGYIIGDEFEYGSVVSFGCNDGYVLEGAASLTCQADGSWDNTEPSCGRRACKRPEEIPNGGVYNTSFLYGDEVTFYCHEGYELLGDRTSLCSADGTWLTQAPQCVMIQCGAPPDIDYGVRTGDSFNFEDMVYYSCVNGYELEGNNLLRCDSKGKWSGSLPSCIPIKCEMPPVIPRATTIVSRLTYGSEVTYKCNPGYKLIGKPTAHCEDDGTWLFDEMASCVPIDCGVFPDISNGYITGDSTTFGSTVYLTCNQGYEMVGEELSSCAESGAWSSTTSVCQPISCGPPRATPHIIKQGDNFLFGGQVIMKCEEGYNLQGDRVVTCAADGTWSGDTPTCQAVVCKKPSVSSPVLMSGSDFSFGQSVGFKCTGGYTLKGSSSIVCLSSGLWSGSTPVCAPVLCGKPRLNEGVKLTGDSFSYSDSVGYSCGTGYNLVGARSARCQENGKWSASSPLCKAVECDPITVSEHIVVLQGNPSVRSSYGASIVFDCKSGYGLSGDDTLICAEDGTWQGTNPTCHRTGPLRDSCDATVDIQHYETILPGFIAGDVIDVQCVKGYSSRGNMTSVCQPDRSWTTPTGHCTRVFCGKPTIRDMVNVWGMSGRSFYYGDHVRFRCRPGLRPSRDPPIITCTETGNWNSDIYCTGRCKFGCLNGGMCVGLNRCKCPYGYAGRRCEQAICIFPCMNGGKCVAPYQCQCEPGYRGHRCEIKTG